MRILKYLVIAMLLISGCGDVETKTKSFTYTNNEGWPNESQADLGLRYLDGLL